MSTKATKATTWLRKLVRDLKQDVPQLTSLLIDNLGVQLLVIPVRSSNMKHYHFIRQCVANGSGVLRSVSHADNIADSCTQSLGKAKFPPYAR